MTLLTLSPEQTQKKIGNAAVDRFAASMREKLAASRAKGRDGW
jgi:hypothetical protein